MAPRYKRWGHICTMPKIKTRGDNQVDGQKWERKEYETWDEAFRGLAPAIRQQSVRVAAYTQVLFVQACASSYSAHTAFGAARMKGQYADLAYKCGLYHQLGKALVPPEYQIWQKDFTSEEQAVYRKYTTDGRLLVASLQEQGVRAKEKRRGELQELQTENIPWLMVRESCQQHMEHWDGTGYPDGRKENAISPIAQIVGLAKELDRLAAETKSETPFDEAYASLLTQGGTAFSSELLEVLKAAKTKCRAVYNKFIHYTLTLPRTIPLVEKRAGRPMGLTYRPMADGEGNIVAYEAIPWFGGIVNRPGEKECAEELEPLLQRTGLISELSMYFVYEASDAVLRIQNCKLPLKGIVVQMLPGFYTQGSQLQRLNQIFKEQNIQPAQLMFTVPEQVLAEANKSTREGIERYLKNGIILLLDGYHPDNIPPEQVRAMGFSYLRLSPELYLQPQTAARMKLLRTQGFVLVGGKADDHDTMAWLAACGAAFSSGTITGVPVTEDDMIRDALARER